VSRFDKVKIRLLGKDEDAARSGRNMGKTNHLKIVIEGRKV